MLKEELNGWREDWRIYKQHNMQTQQRQHHQQQQQQ